MSHPMVVQLPYIRPRLFEIADQPWCPVPIRQQVHQILTFLWLNRIRPFQARAPYEIVSEVLERVVREVEEEDAARDAAAAGYANGNGEKRSELKVLDFCSGAGGPMPSVEQKLNASRKQASLPPTQVQLSDLHPHPSWPKIAPRGGNLTFIPHPVDATAASVGESRHLRTFCLAFHHFGETSARQVLEDAMRHSEGVCIFEMQEPTLGSALTILALFPLSLFITPFTRPSLRALLLTYIIPLIPLVLVFDGLVSAWRTRSTEHLSHLANRAALGVNVEIVDSPRGSFSFERDQAGRGKEKEKEMGLDEDKHQVHGRGRGRGTAMEMREVEWKWEFGRTRHTWPTGDLVWAVGRRDRSLELEDDD